MLIGAAVVHASPSADRPALRLVVVAALVTSTVALGRAALVRDLRERDRQRPMVVAQPKHPVLICNPWSGGGKVAKFGLDVLARAMGVEVVMPDHGLDLEKLARDAAASDYATVGHRLFVNNVSLGLDASQRRRLGTGTEAATVVAMSALGQRRRSRHCHEFTADRFEVRSRSGKAFAGIDGEAIELDTPIDFQIHPRGLRLLVPAGNLPAAEKRRARDVSAHRSARLGAGPEARRRHGRVTIGARSARRPAYDLPSAIRRGRQPFPTRAPLMASHR